MVDKVIERTLVLKSLVLIRQSLFFINFFNCFINNKKLKRKLCLVTSRSRAISQITRTTRHVFNKEQNLGYLYSIQKASW